MAESASGKNEANPMFRLATRAGKLSRLSSARNSSLYGLTVYSPSLVGLDLVLAGPGLLDIGVVKVHIGNVLSIRT